MKKIFIIIFLLLAVSGCEKNNVKVINLSDESYLKKDAVTSVPVLENVANEKQWASLAKEINTAFNNNTLPAGQNFTSRLFIDENGKINKIVIIDGLEENLNKKITASIEKLIFKPAVKEGLPVKYEATFSINTAGGNASLNTDIGGKTSMLFPLSESEFYVAVDQMPEPVGGVVSIQKNIVYPEAARKNGIEGKVYVLAFIDESGNVVKTKVLKGIGYGCDEAAVNAVKSTKFLPAKQNGKSVKVKVTIPIFFKLF